MSPVVTMGYRQILDHLRSGEWKFAARMAVPVSAVALDRMVANGWIERRGKQNNAEIRITSEGLAALTAPVRQIWMR